MSRRALKIGFSAVLLALLTLTLAGCARTVASPQDSAEAVRLRAEDYISDKHLAKGVDELATAITLAPQDADHALRHGEILEAMSRWQDAHASYTNALTRIWPDHPRRNEFYYRLILLALFKLNEPQAVSELLQHLSPTAPNYHDIQGILSARAGEPRQALAHFNRGLAAKPTKEVAARILQHASVAYVALNLSEKAFGALFNAINLADKKPALVQDIETDWNALKAKYGEY